MLAACGIDVPDVLNRAGLPPDLLARPKPAVLDAEYFRLFEAAQGDATLAIRLAGTEGVERISPPIYAAFCSDNGRTFLDRLARYKRLIAPLAFDIADEAGATTLEIRSINPALQVPAFVVLLEFAFLVHAMRLATGDRVVPLSLGMREGVPGDPAEFFGVRLQLGGPDAITFSQRDLNLPFESAHPSMWDYLEPEMARRLATLDVGGTMRAQVRAKLPDLLLAGFCDEQSVAEAIGVSKRTMQRRLRIEGTTFQRELREVRQSLAERYLRDFELRSGDIAGLLAYQEVNSFLRAFSSWTGMSVSAYRRKLADEGPCD